MKSVFALSIFVATLTCIRPAPASAANQVGNARAQSPLMSVVAALEKQGAKGEWFSSVLPEVFQMDGKRSEFYVLQKIPAMAVPLSDLFLLRTQATRDLLERSLNSGVVVVLGDFDSERSQIWAAAIGGFPFVKDALAAAATDRQHVVLIKSDSSPFAFAHEVRHWLDYENQELMGQIDSDLIAFVKSAKIKEAKLFSDQMRQLIIEIRGHATQAAQARLFLSTQAPYLNGAGGIEASNLVSHYAFEQGMAKTIFVQSYQDAFLQLISGLSAKNLQRLKLLLRKYDFSGLCEENLLTFEKSFKF